MARRGAESDYIDPLQNSVAGHCEVKSRTRSGVEVCQQWATVDLTTTVHSAIAVFFFWERAFTNQNQAIYESEMHAAVVRGAVA